MSVDTSNDFALGVTRRGFHTVAGAPCIRPAGLMPYFTTKQAAYRFAAWLLVMAEVLPDEDEQAHSFEDVLKAIQNT